MLVSPCLGEQPCSNSQTTSRVWRRLFWDNSCWSSNAASKKADAVGLFSINRLGRPPEQKEGSRKTQQNNHFPWKVNGVPGMVNCELGGSWHRHRSGEKKSEENTAQRVIKDWEMCQSRSTFFLSETFLISHKVDQKLEAEESSLFAGLSPGGQSQKTKSFRLTASVN